MTWSVYLLRMLALYLVVSALVRSYVYYRREQRERSGDNAVHGSWPGVPAQLLATMQPLGTAALMVALWLAAAMFMSPPTAEAARLVAAAGLFSALWIPRPKMRMRMLLRQKHWQLRCVSYVIVGVTALGFVLYLRSTPAAPSPINVEFPASGSWRVATGGRSPLTNYHHARPAEQNYAVDLELAGDPAKSEGQQVTSPCECDVVRVDTSHRDAPEGNLVVLRTSDQTEIWLAHLQDGSVRVREGQQLRSGEVVAAVGSTGSAESPHLHIHAQRDGHAVPILFGRAGQFPVRGDIITAD